MGLLNMTCQIVESKKAVRPNRSQDFTDSERLTELHSF